MVHILIRIELNTSVFNPERSAGVSRPRVLVLTGSLGMGHHVVTEVVADSLENMGWSTGVFDCMSMLGRLSGKTGDWVFRRITDTPTLYDGVHFSHFRTGSRLAALGGLGRHQAVGPGPEPTTWPAEPADLLVSTFATGASAIAQARRRMDRHGQAPGHRGAVHRCLHAQPVGARRHRSLPGHLRAAAALGAPLRAPRLRSPSSPPRCGPPSIRPRPRPTARAASGSTVRLAAPW